MKNIQTRFSPDTVQDIQKSDLIKLSRELLDATVRSTKIMDAKEMTPKKLQEAKIVLGFLNAANSTMKTKMQYFKMEGLADKVKLIKKVSKKY
jgi:hypothetical protein